MTASAPRPAHTRLPTIDPNRAALQSDLIEALNRRRAGSLILSAQAAGHELAATWIALEASEGAALHVAPLLAEGAVPSLTDSAGRPDAAAAAVALGSLEPVVAAIELVVGQALRPVAVVAEPPGESVVVRVDARTDGALLHSLLLAVNAATQLDAAGALPLDPAAVVDVAPAWTARIAGPAIAPTSVARMSAGDLLLLGTGGVLARFTPPGRDTTLAARLDVRGGWMVVEQELETADAAQPARAEPHPDLSALHVPASVEFDGGGLTLERLAALGVGSVVSVPDAAGGVLPVRLIAGGKRIASGELVAVGDGYGVLVTSVVASAADDTAKG